MNKFLGILGYIIAAVLAAILFRQYEANNPNRNAGIESEQLKELTLENGQLAREKRAYIATVKEMKKQKWIVDDSLKTLIELYRNPEVVYRIKTIYKVDTIKIPFDTPVDYSFERNFEKKTEHYGITGIVNQDGINFNTIEIPNTQRIVTGLKRGLFATEITTTITNSNPYLTTTDIATQKQKVRSSRLGVGPFIGMSIKFEPTFGLGLNYNLFEF